MWPPKTSLEDAGNRSTNGIIQIGAKSDFHQDNVIVFGIEPQTYLSGGPSGHDKRNDVKS
jgi:hypothetical protein